MINRSSTLFVDVAGLLAAQAGLLAQGRGGRVVARRRRRTPKAAAPIDLTGYWVSVVTEDWRYRMVTPAPAITRVFR